jgi:hypothetical protein
MLKYNIIANKFLIIFRKNINESKLHSHRKSEEIKFDEILATVLVIRLPSKVVPCLTNKALRHEGVWGSGFIDPRTIDLGNIYRRAVNFTPQPLYPPLPIG